ncbi:MAG: polymer-forming cytoskeletal protein [Lachnospiraceae bacterium]|nr:polymer-forming cytoskeletal protein [Lachnospiraceae bacterium]
MEEELPIQEELSMEEEPPIQEELSMKEELPIEEEFPMEEVLPTEEEFPMEEELPIQEEFSMEEEPSVVENLTEEVNETVAATEEIVEEEGKKMDVQLKTATDENAIITAGMTVTGDINSEGSMEVIGTINGNITLLGKLNVTGVITGNSKAAEIYADNAKINGEVSSEGAVKIGQSSVVIGNIFAKSAVIAGAVKGDIDVHGPVVLDTSAIVMGNIKSKAVQINNGAVIEGMCSQCYADVNPSSFFDAYKKEKNKK